MVNRSSTLDIIKGLMIIFIIITHFHWAYPDDYLRYGFVFYIDMAVPVFMVITGYLTAINLSKKQIISISQYITISYIVPKMLRFIIPFSIAFLIELPVLIYYRHLNILSLTRTFVQGG